jgi:hypothetical protein
MKTKNILKLAALSAAIMIAGVAQINAATTHLVQNISFTLTFYEQGPTNHPTANITRVTVNRIKVTTKDVIAAIGAATTNNFSANARLVLVKDITSATNVSFVEIRDGTNPPVDVSSFFSRTESFSVGSSFFNSMTGIGSGVKYSDYHLALTNSTLTAGLELRGFAVTTHTSIKDGDVVIGVDEVDADVAGTGVDTNGVPAVVSGSVSIAGRTLKVE